MEPFEYTPSVNDNQTDCLQYARELDNMQSSDGFQWTNNFQSQMMDTIEKMRTEIDFFRSSNGFKNSNYDSNSESSMKDSANSFYSAPNQEYDQLVTENDELRSQI